MAKQPTIYWPFSTSLVSEWPGERPAGWAYHVGTDFRVPQGTPIRATASGTVYLTWNDGYGAYVIDIVTPEGYVIRNGHLSRMDVRHLSQVNAGDHIGLSGGAKGTPGAGLSTGPHLHWEIRTNRNWSGPGWIDPRRITVNNFSDLDNPKKPTVETKKRKNKAMIIVYYRNAPIGGGKRAARWAVAGPKYWLELSNQASANNIAAQLGIGRAFVCGSDAAWNKFKNASK